LYLCTVLIQNPNYLILDEPTNDLDIVTLSVLESILLDYPGWLIVVSYGRYFMHNIVDHLSVFRANSVVEDFPGNYSDIRPYEDSIEREKDDTPKEKSYWKEKQVQNGLTYQEQKELQKIERELKDLELSKKKIEQEFVENLVQPEDIEKKSNELQDIIQKMESKEKRWFELLEKSEG